MTFNLKSALDIKKYYQDKIVGLEVENISRVPITGIFICNKGEAAMAMQVMHKNNLNENFIQLDLTDKHKDKYEVFVYFYDAGTMLYYDIDKTLSILNINKIYSTL